MNFNDYFLRYLSKKGIKKTFISNLLNISYATLRTKFQRDTFRYDEVLFLDAYYKDLNFIENYNRYLALRGLTRDDSSIRGHFCQEGDFTEDL